MWREPGNFISGIGHFVLLLWLLLGDFLFSPDDLPETAAADVSLVSVAEFEQMQQAAEDAPAEAETAPPPPSTRPPARPDTPPPVPETVPEAEVPQPRETPPPVAPPAQEEQPVQTPQPSPQPQLRPARRVAPQVTERPAEPVPEAPVQRQAAREDAAPDAPVVPRPQEAAAPRETAPELATEETQSEQTSLAPKTSLRPQSRPRRPAPTPPVETARASSSAVDSQATNDAVAEALAAEAANNAPSNAEQAERPRPSQGQTAPGRSIAANGPPMSASEKDALRVAINQCWNIATLSTEAQSVTVVVGVTLSPDKTPISSSVKLIESNGASDIATRQAYEAARRAILRCGREGFPLDEAKYDTWKDLRLIFDTRGISVSR